METEEMNGPLREEAGKAVAFLRRRLDPEITAQFGGGEFAERLLACLRARPKPELLFSLDRCAHIAERAEALDPEESAWEGRIADEAVAGRLYAASNPHAESFLAVDRAAFDFRSVKHFDPEAIHGLNRCRWLACLARRYWRARDRRYFDALMREWDFYVAKVPFRDDLVAHGVQRVEDAELRNPTYHDLNAYIRLMNWYWAYWLALGAAEMTPERNALLLARCLRLFDAVAARPFRFVEHNKFTMQMEPLYLWASALPEFTGMPLWKESARRWLETSLFSAVWEDGVQWEKSADYHIGCIRWYGTSYLAGRRWGEAWSEKYGVTLARMAEYLDAIVTPDGHTSLISDSDRTKGWRGGLALARAVFPEMKFRRPVAPTLNSLWFSDGAEWDPADSVGDKARIAVFPRGGVGIARASRGAQAAMTILDNGPTRAGHAHKANLTVHFEALGGPVVVDPGRWIYDGRDPDRVWVVMPWSHNTIIPEETPITALCASGMNPVPVIAHPGDPRVGAPVGVEEGDMLILRSWLSGFLCEPQARVRRTVAVCARADAPWLLVADRIESPAEHRWTNSWLLPAARPVEARQGGWTAELGNGVSVGIAARACEPLDLRDEERFWCPNYAEKSPARWLRFSGRCATGLRLFAFLPSRGGQAEPPTLRVEGNRARLETAAGGWTVRVDE
jgi:hypothetical protein